MNLLFLASLVSSLFACAASADDNLDALKREIEALKRRVTALEEDNSKLKKQVEVDRLIVRNELIVSDTGLPGKKDLKLINFPAASMRVRLGTGRAGSGCAAG